MGRKCVCDLFWMFKTNFEISFEIENFFLRDLGPSGVRMEKWVTYPRIGVYVRMMPDSF